MPSDAQSLRRQDVAIVPYAACYAAEFRALNLAWIQQHFEPEAADYAALDDPQRYILDPGGHIICAVHGPSGAVLGVCALIPLLAADEAAENQPSFELAKMAVRDDAKGLGLGRLVGESALQLARAAGARRVWLESNRALTPAINLYRSIGFVELPFEPSQYQRADIQMEVRF